MKREDIFVALSDIRDDQILPKKRRIKLRPRVWGAIAAALLLVVGGLAMMWSTVEVGTSAQDVSSQSNLALAFPHYVGCAQLAAADYSKRVELPEISSGVDLLAWNRSEEQWGLVADLSGFWNKSALQFLTGGDGDNLVFSPANLYMELCAAAELTDGASREQILELLWYNDITELRAAAKEIWSAGYSEGQEDGRSGEMLLANSLWMDNSTDFKQDTLDILARDYYADSFRGEPGSDEYSQMFRDWLNEHTGRMLEEQVEEESIEASTAFGFASTTYFAAAWQDAFNANRNEDGIFHGASGDVECTYMIHERLLNVFSNEKFKALGWKMVDGSAMMFVLPEEGVTVDEVLADPGYQSLMRTVYAADSFTADSGGEGWRSELYEVELTVPKFDIASRMDLTDGVKDMGVTAMFDMSTGSFKPLSDTPLAMDSIHEVCRVSIDEEGCTGASYTLMEATGAIESSAVDRLRIKLDKPFIFNVITERGLPLYMGVVNEP